MSEESLLRRAGRRLARLERAMVGAGMRIVALMAERRFRRSLEDKPSKRRRRGVHFDLKDR